MDSAGDAYVHYRSPVSGKQKYHICTMDFTTKYVADKLKQKSVMSLTKKDQIKVFCWDLDDFKNIDVRQVTQVIPLNQVING